MTSPFTPRRLRFLTLAAFAAALALTLSAYLSRRRQRTAPPPSPSQIAAAIGQRTQAFSLSKTLGEQTLYTVQAERVTHFKETGKAVLEGVSIVIYGKEGNRRDRISSRECEYDTATGALLIPGEVEMELGLPMLDADSGSAASVAISITTSNLSFDQNTGLAQTQKEVRFRFARGEGTSQGASFDPQQQLLVLDTDVQLTLKPAAPGASASVSGKRSGPGTSPGTSPGTGEDTPTKVRAAHLRFYSEQRKALLSGPVEAAQGTRTLQAGDSVVVLDEHQQAQEVSFSGGVRGTDRSQTGTAELRGERGALKFGEQGKVRTLELDQKVEWAAASLQSRKEGKAERLELSFGEPEGFLRRAVAAGQVRVVLTPAIASSAARPSPSASGEALSQASLAKGTRILSARQADMMFSPDGTALQSIRTQSPSTLELLPLLPREDSRKVVGDEFEMEFGPGGNLAQFDARSNVRFTAEGAARGKRASTSDFLAASFDASTGALQSLRQWGRFRYQDAEWQARSERADYSVPGDKVLLQGEPLVWNATGKLSARRVSLQNATGELDAEEHVSTTYIPNPSPARPAPEPLHVVADRAHYNSGAGRAQFGGHARLWQGATFLVEADGLELDRKTSQVVARDRVFSVFRELPGFPQAAFSKGNPQPLQIRSGYLRYEMSGRQARYEEAVELRNGAVRVTAHELEVFLTSLETGTAAGAAGNTERVERASASGSVVIREGARKATGDRAEYFPDTGRLQLFGNLAAISDPEGNRTQGARLTYFIGDGRISVDGELGSPTEAWWRIHP